MKNITRLFSVLFCLVAMFVLFSCSPAGQYARKAVNCYTNRQYSGAVSNGIEALKLEPFNEKALKVFQPAYDQYLLEKESELQRLERQASSQSGNQLADTRGRLLKIYEELDYYYKQIKILKPYRKKTNENIVLTAKDFSTQLIDANSKLGEAKQQAAELHYNEGARLFDLGGTENCKASAREFKQALSFVANYKDANDRYEQSRKAAVIRMAIFPMKNKSGFYLADGLGSMITNKVYSQVNENTRALEFYELISRGDDIDIIKKELELANTGMVDDNTKSPVSIKGINEFFIGEITLCIINEPQKISKEFEESREVVVKTETYKDSNGKEQTREIKELVKARVKTYAKKLTAKTSVAYKVIDIKTSTTLLIKTHDEPYEWNCEWGSYSGDKRALSSRSAGLCAKSEQFPPAKEDIMNYLSDGISKTISRDVISYMSR